VLVLDEVTAPYVRELFRMVASGTLTARGAAVWVAGLPDAARGGRALRHSAVRRVLTFAVYVGRFEPDDERHAGERGRWEPLIDQETWDRAQVRLAATKGRKGPISGAHLLSGMIRCASCGGRMSGWTLAQRWKRYRCSGFASSSGYDTLGTCQGTAGAKPIDDAVLAEVRALLAPVAGSDTVVRSKVSWAWERLRQPDDEVAKERDRATARAKRDAKDARRRIVDATRLFVDEKISPTAYAALAATEQARLESAERTLAAPEIQATSRSLPSLSEAMAMLGDWETALTGGPVSAQRPILTLLIESVVPRRISYGKYKADIAWTPIGRMFGAAAGRDAQQVAQSYTESERPGGSS
jgi:hypothetical protein